MKYFLIAAAILFSFVSCNNLTNSTAEQGSLEANAPKIVFAEDVKNFDFGELVEGQQVEHKFKFKNEGEFPLIINNISTSCGCTTPEWPRDPIGPGEESTILVKFNSKNKMGPQRKTVSIYANTVPAYNEIQFVAVVNAADSTKRRK